MKRCPHPKCRVDIPASQFACSAHWKLIPGNMRTAIVDAYWRAKNDLCSFAEVVWIENEVRAELHWRSDAQVIGCDRIGMAKCPNCGAKCWLTVKEGGQPVSLEETTKARAAFYIIGLVAVAAGGECDGSYTPFEEHRCRRTEPTAVPLPTRHASKTFTPSG